MGEVILNSPVKAVASNTLSIMPSNCLVCNGGGISAPRLQNTSTPNIPEIRRSYKDFYPYQPDNTPEWYAFRGRANWGIATPNGFRLSFNGVPHSNMGLHAGGDNNSIWTSWTPMKDVAMRFALGRNKVGGVLLTKSFTMGTAIPNTSFMATEYYADEYEFLVPGIVVGAHVTPIKR